MGLRDSGYNQLSCLLLITPPIQVLFTLFGPMILQVWSTGAYLSLEVPLEPRSLSPGRASQPTHPYTLIPLSAIPVLCSKAPESKPQPTS